MKFSRVFLIVLDGVGCGEAPDTAAFGDSGSDTLGNIARAVGGVSLPTLEAMGLGRVGSIQGVNPARARAGAYGVMIEKSSNKDTTSGHWEMAGVVVKDAFPTYPRGFPPEIIDAFEKEIDRKVLGNKAASGTDIIKELGGEHVRTGRPIVYTSADSVFQIAAHEDVIPLEELYSICKTARRILQGRHRVGRVIARPFTGPAGQFKRTPHRHDYSIEPPEPTLLDRLKAARIDSLSIGKISDIFAGRGITGHYGMETNAEGMKQLADLADGKFRGLAFLNLVDFDMLYGHRNDVQGFAASLKEFDTALGGFLKKMKPTDLAILTADHGNDPTTPSTDHSRELVPLLAWHSGMTRLVDLGRRQGFWDIGQTVAENFGVEGWSGAASFLAEL
ncbi:phosphopentomutase [bacterium]|nr:phosphopentomutase [bacterium]